MLDPMRRTMTTMAALAALAWAPTASAQGRGGGSSMGQGEARITARSDVRLSMESVPGTGGATISALGARVGARMAQIRQCYEDVVSERPTVEGRLRLRMTLPRRGRPRIEVAEDGTDDRALVRCVRRELTRVDCNQIRRPAGAIVRLEMSNTAAEGVAESSRRSERRREVQVQIDGEGNATATGGNPRRGVRFTVTGDGRDSAPAVVAAHRALTRALPGLTDCRRRAGNRGRDPSGEISVVLRIREGRPPGSRVTRSTVAYERTRGCVSRVLRRVDQRAEAGSGRVRAQIRYSADVE